MQEAYIDREISNLDLSKIGPLQQKRSLAFVNHFVVTTAQFLNNFMRQCECKLMQFERKLEKVEATLVLLENRLSSIPEINAFTPSQSATKVEARPELVTSTDHVDNVSSADNQQVIEPTEDISESLHAPEYERFIKMVQVGVPLDAVKLKVSLEGLDPGIFEKIMKK